MESNFLCCLDIEGSRHPSYSTHDDAPESIHICITRSRHCTFVVLAYQFVCSLWRDTSFFLSWLLVPWWWWWWWWCKSKQDCLIQKWKWQKKKKNILDDELNFDERSILMRVGGYISHGWYSNHCVFSKMNHQADWYCYHPKQIITMNTFNSRNNR